MELVGTIVAVLWTVSAVYAENYDCAGITKEHLAEIRNLTLTSDDLHAKLVGNYSWAWGKPELTENNSVCVGWNRELVNETELSFTAYRLAKSGERSGRRATWEEVVNGIYSMPTGDISLGVSIYILYNKHDVIVAFFCNPQATRKDDKDPQFFTIIEVRKEALKTPMDPQVQAAMDEAVAMVKAKPEVFGSIGSFDQTCYKQ